MPRVPANISLTDVAALLLRVHTGSEAWNPHVGWFRDYPLLMLNTQELFDGFTKNYSASELVQTRPNTELVVFHCPECNFKQACTYSEISSRKFCVVATCARYHHRLKSSGTYWQYIREWSSLNLVMHGFPKATRPTLSEPICTECTICGRVNNRPLNVREQGFGGACCDPVVDTSKLLTGDELVRTDPAKVKHGVDKYEVMAMQFAADTRASEKTDAMQLLGFRSLVQGFSTQFSGLCDKGHYSESLSVVAIMAWALDLPHSRTEVYHPCHQCAYDSVIRDLYFSMSNDHGVSPKQITSINMLNRLSHTPMVTIKCRCGHEVSQFADMYGLWNCETCPRLYEWVSNVKHLNGSDGPCNLTQMAIKIVEMDGGKVHKLNTEKVWAECLRCNNRDIHYSDEVVQRNRYSCSACRTVVRPRSVSQ